MSDIMSYLVWHWWFNPLIAIGVGFAWASRYESVYKADTKMMLGYGIAIGIVIGHFT